MMKTKNLLTLLLCTVFTFHVHANTLVITRGPVCSGMGSYLAHGIQSLDNSYYIVSQNDIFYELCYALFSTVFPHHMEIINKAIEQENITAAITFYHLFFKKTANQYEKEQAIEAIKEIQKALNDPTNENFLNAFYLIKNHDEMAQLASHAACGHNVVWEKRTFNNWDYDTAQVESLFSNVFNTITYCPATTMIEQWLERNAQAIAEESAPHKRLVKQVLKSFFNCFKPTQDEYQDDAIVLTKDEFDAIIDQAANYIQTVPQDEFGENGIFTNGEFTLEELFQFKANMYAEFDFDNVDYVILAPVLTYDVLLSSKEGCLNFAQELING